MKKFVSLGAALMSGAVLAREKPTAFQATVASHGAVKAGLDLRKPVAIPREEREDSPAVERQWARKEKQHGHPDQLDNGSRGTSVQTNERPETNFKSRGTSSGTSNGASSASSLRRVRLQQIGPGYERYCLK